MFVWGFRSHGHVWVEVRGQQIRLWGKQLPLVKGPRPGLRCQVPCSWQAEKPASPIRVLPHLHNRAPKDVGSLMCSAHPSFSGDAFIQQIPARQFLQFPTPP